MTDDNQINPAFFEFVSQVAHCATTFAITFVALTAFGWWGAFAAVGVLIYATWHEFWYDPRYENAITRGSDWEDWGFLMAGPVLAAGVHLLLGLIR